MRYQRDVNQPPRDRRVEYGLADQAREDKRKQDDTHIDSAATKWRYRPRPTPKNDA